MRKYNYLCIVVNYLLHSSVLFLYFTGLSKQFRNIEEGVLTVKTYVKILNIQHSSKSPYYSKHFCKTKWRGLR